VKSAPSYRGCNDIKNELLSPGMWNKNEHIINALKNFVKWSFVYVQNDDTMHRNRRLSCTAINVQFIIAFLPAVSRLRHLYNINISFPVVIILILFLPISRIFTPLCFLLNESITFWATLYHQYLSSTLLYIFLFFIRLILLLLSLFTLFFIFIFVLFSFVFSFLSPIPPSLSFPLYISSHNWFFFFIIIHTSLYAAGAGTAVITLGYGLDSRGFESRQGLEIFLFTTASRPALGPTQPPI